MPFKLGIGGDNFESLNPPPHPPILQKERNVAVSTPRYKTLREKKEEWLFKKVGPEMRFLMDQNETDSDSEYFYYCM